MNRLLIILIVSASLLGTLMIQAQELSIPQNRELRYLALGDSYTIGQGVTPQERWPAQLRDSMEAAGYGFDTLYFIAATGWNTGSLLNNIRGKGLAGDYDMVSLLIGVNNQFQGGNVILYAMQFEQLLDSAIVYAGGDPQRVFVLSIPDYAYTPGYQNDPEISQEIDQFNTANRLVCEDRNVPYFNITPISRDNDPSLISNDGLHPSGFQYSLWVQEIMQAIPDLVTSALEYHSADLSVYPLPARQSIRIRGASAIPTGELKIEWIHADGSIVATSVIVMDAAASESMEIPIPDALHSGMHYLRLSGTSGNIQVYSVPVWR